MISKRHKKRIRIILYIFPLIIISSIPEVFGYDSLPEELEDVTFRDGFFESQFDEVGSISSISGKGKAVILRRAVKEAFFAKEKDPIYENDAIYTLKDCKCRIIFKDKNVAMMAQDSSLDIDKIYADIREEKKDAVLSMAKGKVIFYVLRLFSYREMSLRLKTPTAIIGVRGTKFGSEIEKIDKSRSEITLNMVADLSNRISRSDTVDTLTRIYVIEGEVDVTSLIDGSVKQLHINEILEAGPVGLGEVIFDPQRIRAFTETVSPDTTPPSRSEPEMDSKEIYTFFSLLFHNIKEVVFVKIYNSPFFFQGS